MPTCPVFAGPVTYMITYVCIIVLPVLKSYYSKLSGCLPQNYVNTVDKLKQMIPGMQDDFLDLMRMCPSTEAVNEQIIYFVMGIIREDDHVFEFCDIMENLCKDVFSRNLIEALRNGNYIIVVAM